MDDKMKKKTSFSSRAFRGGAYTSIITAVVIVLVLLLNMVVSKLDLSVDLTKASMFSISEETVQFLEPIQDEIVLHYFAETGQETNIIQEVVEKIAALKPNISVVYVDPMLRPNYALSMLGAEVTQTLEADSIVVENKSNNRKKLVLYSDMIIATDTTAYSDAEGQIDSAIMYVTNENLPTMYVVTGHGETELGETIESMIANQNITVASLETLTAERIPDDCDILMINYPVYDFIDSEVEIIKSYLQGGGKAIINVSYLSSGLPQLESLLNYYGVGTVEGILIEGNAKYYRNSATSSNQTVLLPVIASHKITESIKGKRRIEVPTTTGLCLLDGARQSIQVTELLTTTDASYSKVDLNSTTLSQEEADIPGPFAASVLIEEDYNGVKTQLLVNSSLFIFTDVLISSSSYGNADFFINGINYIADIQNTLSVRTSDLLADSQFLDMDSSQISKHVIVKLVALPACILAAGIIILITRRRRA